MPGRPGRGHPLLCCADAKCRLATWMWALCCTVVFSPCNNAAALLPPLLQVCWFTLATSGLGGCTALQEGKVCLLGGLPQAAAAAAAAALNCCWAGCCVSGLVMRTPPFLVTAHDFLSQLLSMLLCF